MSWSIKITILYVSFVLLIVAMVTMAMRQKVDLVATDYYEQELNYQQRIDCINRTQKLSQPLTWSVQKDTLLLHFPAQLQGKEISANIYFFRPSDASMDNSISLIPDTVGIRKIAINQLQQGIYKMQINWQCNKEEYYNEGVIKIN